MNFDFGTNRTGTTCIENVRSRLKLALLWNSLRGIVLVNQWLLFVDNALPRKNLAYVNMFRNSSINIHLRFRVRSFLSYSFQKLLWLMLVIALITRNEFQIVKNANRQLILSKFLFPKILFVIHFRVWKRDVFASPKLFPILFRRVLEIWNNIFTLNVYSKRSPKRNQRRK